MVDVQQEDKIILHDGVKLELEDKVAIPLQFICWHHMLGNAILRGSKENYTTNKVRLSDRIVYNTLFELDCKILSKGYDKITGYLQTIPIVKVFDMKTKTFWDIEMDSSYIGHRTLVTLVYPQGERQVDLCIPYIFNRDGKVEINPGFMRREDFGGSIELGINSSIVSGFSSLAIKLESLTPVTKYQPPSRLRFER